MVFYEHSSRRCSPANAQQIAAALRRNVKLCGVFVNAPLELLVATATNLGLSLLQLQGEEGPAYCAEAARRSGARVIKAAQVRDAGDVRELERFHVDFHLLDAGARDTRRAHLRGGTGDTFDWSLISGRRSQVPLILSGGLTAENVGEAVAAVHPYAVDTASGTEAAPGRKDQAKLLAFFASTRQMSAAPPQIGLQA